MVEPIEYPGRNYTGGSYPYQLATSVGYSDRTVNGRVKELSHIGIGGDIELIHRSHPLDRTLVQHDDAIGGAADSTVLVG